MDDGLSGWRNRCDTYFYVVFLIVHNNMVVEMDVDDAVEDIDIISVSETSERILPFVPPPILVPAV